MVNLSVNIGKLKLNNPVLVAAGTFGCAEEFQDLIDLNKLGAIVTKTVTLSPKFGNPMPRTIETPYGMLNSIGLANQGIDDFIKYKIPFLNKLRTAIIVSISGESEQELAGLANILDQQRGIDGIELNISCPNIRGKTRLIAQDPKATHRAVKIVRKYSKKSLITKLSPNVTDIVQIARAAQEAGSDALSLINTIYGMSVDLNKRKPHLACGFGGLSGPAIKPIALHMVYQVAKQIKLPIIGMGGIMSPDDALEFIIAGATAIATGTANYVNPKVSIEIINGIRRYLIKHKINNIKKLRGTLRA
ncbi:MAG: dihydroorotate dehydrogenase [Candidatus Omnitrophota bacterium]|jgi:dihydroorotate dehydrogenase (NAD+) catalytic subunit